MPLALRTEIPIFCSWGIRQNSQLDGHFGPFPIRLAIKLRKRQRLRTYPLGSFINAG